MTMLKKLLATTLAGTMLLSCAACGEQEEKVEQDAAPSAVQKVEQLINTGDYAGAYQALNALTRSEAAVWENKLVYVPKTYTTSEQVGSSSAVTSMEFFYDEQGFLVKYIGDALGIGVETTYEYDEAGRVILSKADSSYAGLEQIYSYDDQARTCTESSAMASIEGQAVYYANEQGQLVRIDASSEEQTLQYDAAGRLVSRCVTSGQTAAMVTYEYDTAGRMISKTLQLGDQKLGCINTYDASGRMTEKRYTANDKDVILLTCQCDKAGNVIRMYGNGLEITTEWELRYYPNGVPSIISYYKWMISDIKKYAY